jgi:hypothetical protein
METQGTGKQTAAARGSGDFLPLTEELTIVLDEMIFCKLLEVIFPYGLKAHLCPKGFSLEY